MKLAFVIQRYGLEVNGGAELHCRWLAERLARRHQVEVFATRALDYLEWRNHYPKGTEVVNGIPVHRSSVKRTRNARVFASLSNVCFHEAHTREEEIAWVRENGPYSPELVKAVTAERGRFDRIFFYCYPLLPQLPRRPGRGGPRDPGADRRGGPGDRARDHEAALPRAARRRLPDPRGAGARRGRERQRLAAERRHRQRHQPARGRPGARLPPQHGLDRPFLLYVGRIDRNKGALTLFAYFKKFLEETSADVDLVLAGKPAVPIPDHPRIRHVGFISEEEKVAALRQCRLLVMPSPYESLSVIVLEAWKLGVPVLANARCKVLAGQCLRSNGGLFYHGYAEFAEALRLLLEQDALAASLGRQGQAYVEREYSWETIDAKIEELLARTGSQDLRPE